MLYRTLAKAYDAIESVSGSLEKIRIFSELLSQASPEEVEEIIGLTMGKLHPDWKGEPEIGIAEKTAVQVIAVAASVSEKVVKDTLQKTGDIGTAAELLLGESTQGSLFAEDLTIATVFKTLEETARASGPGSNKIKVSKIVGLLADADTVDARYVIRTITGSLRLGLGDMGIIDALSVAFTGSRDARDDIERAYNMCSDLGRVGRVLASEGIDAVRVIKAEVGVPIRMMAAKRLSTPEEILEKTGGRALVEYKYDGERVQVHKNGNDVILYSRRQEVITHQYPDVVELVQKHVKAATAVMEGECVAIDPKTGRTRPFQELMRRRRKVDIDETMAEVPVALFFFDVLFLDGEDVTSLPLLRRRNLLEKTVEQDERVHLTSAEETSDPNRLQEIFEEALETGHEGVMAKAIHAESTYQAGSRSWLWIKLKASYTEGMADSVDLVVVGGFHGRGKRTGVYGAILASVYDPVEDTFPTVCKIGTGFTEDMLDEFKDRLEKHLIDQKSPKVDSDIEADVWFEPVEVIEVIGDEITVSPTHPAGKRYLEEGGLAIRFPRFTGRWRDDKDARQATTVNDLIEMFERQRRISHT
ncbi:MAG: ATP-dependent DNA ligase [Candidatus Thorarchaeota archaeon]|nr:MAG: ATP-dependent DNA ligase [Candidatus Thorarchaeota archaeon]RLI58807.1 MAG: ATP-dependent DNA ligase [Candidatus Thorarchaeota archaeon]